MFSFFMLYLFILLNYYSDIDECDTGADNCHGNAICTDTDGGFYCNCTQGYEGDGEHCQSMLFD